MSKLRVPYQCLEVAGNLLVAARGSNIDLFSLEDQSQLSTWKYPSAHKSITGEASQQITQELAGTNSEPPALPALDVPPQSPPAKRRKLSDGSKPQNPCEEGTGKKGLNDRSDSIAAGLDTPAIITLAVARGGKHVIAATGEDKCIWVFEIVVKENGKHYLKSVSQRAMPKRPCALAVTDDDSTIITADKFGDVYSLPLILSEVEGYTTPSDIGTPAQAKDTTPKPFIPAANHLTVHSQRNRKALENQRQQANKTSQKSEPTFEHKLLLGHVSMLTDVALAGFQGRSYIITADRDEHIRISRGIAQSHIIEGFCLGHTEFVSRLCIPQGRSNLLISGGGDDELFVWDWLSSSLISKADLRSLVEDIICDSELGIDGGRPIAEVKVAVSGISHARLSSRNGSEDIIIATCEGVPALFTFSLTPENSLKYIETVKLPGNALAVVNHTTATSTSGSESRIVVSVDSISKPGSTTERRTSADDVVDRLHVYRFKSNELVAASTFEMTNVDDESQSVRLTNFLYNLENLRKSNGAMKELE